MFKVIQVAFVVGSLSVYAGLLNPAPALALSKIDLLFHTKNGLTNFWILRANPTGRSHKKPLISMTLNQFQISQMVSFEAYPQMFSQISTPQIRAAEFLKRGPSQLPISAGDFYGLSLEEVQQVSAAFDWGKLSTLWFNLSTNGLISIYAIYYANGSWHTYVRPPTQLVADQEIFAPAMREVLAIETYLSFVGDEGGTIPLPEDWVGTTDILPVQQFLTNVKLHSRL